MDCEYSIIICTRNRSGVLRRALAFHASLDPTYELTHEYIVVDNGSTDTTREVVEEFATMVSCPVHYVFEARAGHSIALNAGCRQAQGTRLIFTDDDTLPFVNWLRVIHDVFISQGADWVFGPVIPKWEFGPTPVWYGPETSLFLACVNLGDQVLVNDELTCCFAGANHACLRSKIFDLGLYDENLGIRGDGQSFAGNDDDLYRRARQAGLKIVYSPNAGVEHLIAENRYSKKNHRSNSWTVGKNQFRALRTAPPAGKKWLGIPRYYYAASARTFGKYFAAVCLRQKSRAFFQEIQLIRFSSMLNSAVREFILRKR